MPTPAVIVIDDDKQVRRFLRAGFELEGFTVFDAAHGIDGLHIAVREQVDLVIIDLGLSDPDGAEIVGRLRSWSTVPIIVLSERQEQMKIQLLELGAEDYVVKPFGMSELLARARAAMCRHVRTPAGDDIFRSGDLAVDFGARAVTRDGRPVPLSAKEYALIQILARHAGNVVTQEQLLKSVCGATPTEGAHDLRMLVRELRWKIEKVPAEPKIILTELGVGYRLAIPLEFSSLPG